MHSAHADREASTIARMADLTLHDLVRNRTMSPAMAATLALAAEERRSMLFVAIPRMAGKTATMTAALACAPAGTTLHHLSRSAGTSFGIPAAPDGGYLVMAEISSVGYPEYLWGHEVQFVFEAARAASWPLVTALHAGGLEQAFRVICEENGVPDTDAAIIDLVVYIRSFGPWQAPARRVVESLYEIESVTGGRPVARLLHAWSDATDSFEDPMPAARLGTRSGSRERLLRAFEA